MQLKNQAVLAVQTVFLEMSLKEEENKEQDINQNAQKLKKHMNLNVMEIMTMLITIIKSIRIALWQLIWKKIYVFVYNICMRSLNLPLMCK